MAGFYDGFTTQLSHCKIIANTVQIYAGITIIFKADLFVNETDLILTLCVFPA